MGNLYAPQRSPAWRLAEGSRVLLRPPCIVHKDAPPSDEEWGVYHGAVAGCDLTKTRSFVLTFGGGPNAKQREMMNDLLKGRQTLAVVVSDSVWVRMIVKALSWRNPLIEIFSSGEIEQAWKHLKMTPAEITEATRALAELRRKLGV